MRAAIPMNKVEPAGGTFRTAAVGTPESGEKMAKTRTAMPWYGRVKWPITFLATLSLAPAPTSYELQSL
jgi:hypothetical protein